MSPRKSADSYSDQELKEITERWRQDKARIDADPALGYYRDRDKEYERHLCNANLKALFRHAAWLRNQRIEGYEPVLYSKEIPLISEVYRGIVQNGYFSRSKATEKKIRAWLGKIVSRQHRPKKGH